jgi:hypothetical protein
MFPKKGNNFPKTTESGKCKLNYQSAIAAALSIELGNSHRAVKTVMRWTGANERTVKNWLLGAVDHAASICCLSFGTQARCSKLSFGLPVGSSLSLAKCYWTCAALS